MAHGSRPLPIVKEALIPPSLAVPSNGHAGLRPTNEIQHGFRTGRTGLRHFERSIAV